MNSICIPLLVLILIVVGIIVSLNRQDDSAANTREDHDPNNEDQLIEDIVQLDMIDNEWEDDR